MDLNKLTQSEKIIAGSGIALLVFSFMPWYGRFGVSANGWDYFLWGVIPTLLGMLMVAQVAVSRFTETKLPDLPISWGQAHLIAGCVAAGLIFLKLVMGEEASLGYGARFGLDRQFGLFLSLLSAIGLAFGAFTMFNEASAASGESAAPTTTPSSSATISSPVTTGELADFGTRLGAYLIDVVVVAIPFWLVVAVLGSIAEALGAIAFVGGIAAMAWYFAHYEGGPTGQTIGKRTVGIAVVDARTLQTGIGLGRGVGRYFARALSSMLCGIPLGYLWMLWDADRQTWHDKLTNTKVVRVSR